MSVKKAEISGWGNYPKRTSLLVRPEKISHVVRIDGVNIPRGLGRSYGDAALNEGRHVVLMERIDRFIHFDAASGFLRAEAGCTLSDILEVFVPKGWFLPVTPGTKFTTLGGCIAADVHGKNHHRKGAISSYLHEITLVLANGDVRKCSKTVDADLFWATVGGMGLTGIILEAVLELIPIETAYMSVAHYDACNLEKSLELLSDKSIEDDYSVAWIDCLSTGKALGRSVVMVGHHARLDELTVGKEAPLSLKTASKISMPFNLPSWALNGYTVKTFNSLYYFFQRRKGAFITDYDSYFYPLDRIGQWNRLYGKRGFVQYQFAIPVEGSGSSLRRILEKLSASRRGSFLAVLKKFGKENPGYLSFPFEGFTLALDLPVSDEGLFRLLKELDALVLEAGGRVYLAKDASLDPAAFRQMYPRYPAWLAIKQSVDEQLKFQSDLSRRLKIGVSV